MSADQTVRLQDLVDRMRQGDDAARQELVACTYERLRLLARKLLHHDFPRLQHAHGTGSVLNEAALRLLSALQEVPLASVQDFFRFAALQMRRVLIDMARRQGRREEPLGLPAGSAESAVGPLPDPADDTHDPARMAVWTEFHCRVEALPEEERQVVDLCWYQGLTQQESADLLGISQKEVSRRWIRARLKLVDAVSGLRELL